MKITILCPHCQTPCQQWRDEYGITNWRGCIHVLSLISIDGTEQFEFASSQVDNK